jgi:TolB-like protein
MPEHPNKMSQLWKELKRRKVFRVISVYAAAAFAILELSDIVAPSLGMPPWTLSFIIIILIIGFILAVILSWIYDIRPGGGIVKTEPVYTEKQGRKKKESGSWKIASYLSLVVIVALIILNIIPDKGAKGESEILDKSIAVLPFQNLSEEEGNEHFVDGLVEDLLSRLSVIEQLRVISRTSSDMYRERGMKSVPVIASELKVAYIVEGSVQRYGNKARITVQLINARKDQHLWAKSYDRNIEDVFKTQSEIAMRIASELNTILTSTQEFQIQETSTENIEAFEYYQMGRYYWNKRTGEGYRKSIEYFDKAIEADPDYALAYAGKADTYNLMALQGWMNRQEGRDEAVELVYQALDLDENLAEAYTVLGTLMDFVDFDWEGAEQAFQRALKLNPNYATAHQYYAEHLSCLGKNDMARMHIDRAVELDPLSFIKRYRSARMYLDRRQFPEALESINKASELHEGHPWIPKIQMVYYWEMNLEEQAFEAFKNNYASDPEYDIEATDSIYILSGFQGVLEWKIGIHRTRVWKNDSYYSLATECAMAGLDEEALDWLEEAIENEGDGWRGGFTGVSIEFHHLHQDPRFLAILEKMGLDKYPVYGQQIPD